MTNDDLHERARCRIHHLIVLLFFLWMATGAMVLEGVVSESDDVGHNRFVSSLVEDPIMTTSEWSPINPLGVR